ncbi:ABC transporter ATP-binding protein [Rhodococcus sp. NPDC058521]|uniref:ABC transporter ATP-binding protein n=1 Tax=Rhodococcus sp. NPDC058521 TaxID=3346536 RepID=UPI00365F9BBF
MRPLLQARGLVKHFGATTALEGIDLTARSGEVLAVLGRNGAGKTTFIRLLATLLRPDAGAVEVFGKDTVTESLPVRRLIGLAGQNATVEPLMTGAENLVMIGVMYGLSHRDARTAAYAVLDRLGLADRVHDRVASYSGGMRRRLDLGASLVGRPRVLLLDEPTTGLDPASRHALWELVHDLVADGTDVIVTTQYLEEVDVLADRVVIFDHGRIVADDSPEHFKTSHGEDIVQVRTRDPEGLAVIEQTVTQTQRTGIDVDRLACSMSWQSPTGGQDAARCFTEAAAGDFTIEEITVRRPSLEEAFLALTESEPSPARARSKEALR